MSPPQCPGRPPPATWVLAAVAALALAALAAGCAGRAADVAARPADAAQFAGWSCERIDDEAERVQRRAAEVAWAVDERSGNNIVALGVGVMIFWPALLALRPDGPEADDLAQLKGRFEALRQASAQARCPPPSAELPAARAAALPVAPGDRLIYEERPFARRAASESRWTVRALRRDEVEYTLAPAPAATSASSSASASAPASISSSASASAAEARPPAPVVEVEGEVSLRHDRIGNVLGGPAGTLRWPRLLRGDLALGQVMAGEIGVVGDPQVRARVRAQVVAVGPQQVSGRRFDAAVLELFGDVLAEGPGATRLDGVLVVDRASGVLLRLDLRSAQPPLRVMRRLVRVEPR